MLGAERLNELGVLRLVAPGRQHAELGLPLVKGLGALVQATRQTVVNQSVLENNLQGRLHVHNYGSLSNRHIRRGRLLTRRRKDESGRPHAEHQAKTRAIVQDAGPAGLLSRRSRSDLCAPRRSSGAVFSCWEDLVGANAVK
eukprot:scaffold5212_cov108-Isochrysis_galbana.AAC.3